MQEEINYSFEDLMEDSEDGARVREVFKIDTDLKADWALKIIKKEEAEAKRLIDVIELEKEVLDSKIKKLQEKANCGFLKGRLADYFETIDAELLKVSKTQANYKLPSGSIGVKAPAIEYIKDEDSIIASLTAEGKESFIKIKRSVDWANLKKEIEILDTMIIDKDGNFIEDAYIDDDGLTYKKSKPNEFVDAFVLRQVPVYAGTHTIVHGIEIQEKPASFIVKCS